MKFIVLSVCLMTILTGCGVEWFPDGSKNVTTPTGTAGTTAPVVNTVPFTNAAANLTATLSPFQSYSTSDTVAAHYRISVSITNNNSTAASAQLIVAPQDTNSATIPALGLSFSTTAIQPAESRTLTGTTRVLLVDVSKIKIWQIITLGAF